MCGSFSADSSRELGAWLKHLNEGIRDALSCSEVALRLWAAPWNKVCGDCGSSAPEWASVNLLVLLCQDCAGEPPLLEKSLNIHIFILLFWIFLNFLNKLRNEQGFLKPQIPSKGTYRNCITAFNRFKLLLGNAYLLKSRLIIVFCD